MKAVVCSAVGNLSGLQIQDLPSPKARPNEIVVRVRAAGINFPDALMITGKYQHVPPIPFTPGKELAGDVVEVGSEVSRFKVGDRVCAHLAYGAFAEEVAINVDHSVIGIPRNLEYVPAAAFPLAYSTSMHILCDRARIQPGELLLVLGASGGVGIAAIQLGKLLGARVIACASSDEKLAFCKKYGVDEVVNYATQDLRESLKELTMGRGVDVVCDPVGGSYSEPAIRSMAWNGRYCVVGFAAGTIPRIPANLMLLKGCSILGCALGSNAKRDPSAYIRNLDRMSRWIEEGKLMPAVTRTFPIENTAEALNEMMQRNVLGKTVITIQ